MVLSKVFCALFLFSIIFINTIHAQPYPVVSQDVQFISNAPSGNLTLLGTVTLPQGAPGPFPGIVLIAGSGAGQRNESTLYTAFNFYISPPKYPACGQETVNVSTFVDIANFFSSMGFAVLRYDKRTCIAQGGVPGCTYPLCPLNDPNPPSNCLNLNAFTAWDLVTDASSAVRFLATIPKIDASNITVMGHSEGCTIAPYVANNNTANVKQVVLLAGVGASLADVAIDQLAKQIIYQETLIGACTVMGAPETTIALLEKQLTQIIAILEETAAITPLILNGTYPSNQLVAWVGSTTPVGYVQSINAMGQFLEIFSVISRFVNNGGNVLAINSPTDFQVYAKYYNPLHAALQSILNNPQAVAIVDGLTHMLTPSDFSNGNVSPSVFEAILSWGTNTTFLWNL